MYYKGKNGGGRQFEMYNLIKRINNYRQLSKKLVLLREDDCLEKRPSMGMKDIR